MSIPIVIPVGLPGGSLADPGLAGAPPVTVDVDGDGKADAFVVNTGGGLVVTGAGGVDVEALFGDPAPAGAPPATIDFDGDGKADGVVVNIGGQLVVTAGPAAGEPPLPTDFGDLTVTPPGGGAFVILPIQVTFSDGEVMGSSETMQAWIF